MGSPLLQLLLSSSSCNVSAYFIVEVVGHRAGGSSNSQDIIIFIISNGTSCTAPVRHEHLSAFGDVELLTGLRALNSPPDSPARQVFKGFLQDTESILVKQGVLVVEDDHQLDTRRRSTANRDE